MKEKIESIFTFRFKPDYKTFIVFICGLLSIGLSYALLLSDNPIIRILLRDVLQVLLIGIVVPFLVMSRERTDFIKSGMKFDQALKYLLIGITISILLIIMFVFKDPDWQTKLTWGDLNAGWYVFITNIFEVIFFFIFIRYYIEKAFGIIPAIIISALFYSMHHAGFQPEFIKLLIVGLAYITAFRVVNHWLFILPIWWVSGLWDVLIGSDVVSEIGETAWISALVVLVVMIVVMILKYPFRMINTTS
jgi:hypothetical protein